MESVICANAVRADLDQIRQLLEGVSLPSEDIADHLSHFILAKVDGELVGCIGLEVHGSIGLLRSLAVDEGKRNRGIARRLMDRIIDHSRQQGVSDMYLLTDTAARYFERLGWTTIDRADAPEEIRNTLQFRSLCPSSAICMRR